MVFLLGPFAIQAQIQQTQNVTFETTKQSLWDANPAHYVADTMRLLQDNGLDASFFVPGIDINAMIEDPNLGPTGFQVKAKFGLDFDLYTRSHVNDGSADITYPVEIKFTKPNDNKYGCGEDVTINTNYSLLPGYKLELEEPLAEFAMGVQMNTGFLAAARACFTGNCAEDGIDIGNPSFVNANSGNFHNYLADGYYDYLRISTSDGLEMPWDLVPLIPAPPGVPSYTLPYDIDPAVAEYAKISGTLDQPFRDFDRTDQLMGNAIVDKGSHKFMDIQFDPIQFQEYITHVPLEFSLNVGPVHMNLAVLSVPIIFRNSFYHEFKFDPSVKVDIDLGRTMVWKEMNGAIVVQTAYSQQINGFTVGNNLVLTLPDNAPVSIAPVAKLRNTFYSKLNNDFTASLAFRMMHGHVTVDGVGSPLIDEDIPGLNVEAPLGSKTDRLLDTQFEMGGFNTAPLNAIQLHPDNVAPTLLTKNIAIAIPANGGPATITPQDVVSIAFDPQGGNIRYLSVTPNSFDCSKLGQNTVTVVIDDSRCNQTTATAIVTVIDNTKPTIACKSAIASLNASGQASIQMQDVFQSGTDNCGVVNLQSVSPNAFNCSHYGLNTVVLTANDSHGNTNTCQAFVVVVDAIPPTVTCKPATIYLNNSGAATLVPADIFLSGADNCGTVNMHSLSRSQFSCSDIGTTNIVLTVNDGHDNFANCNAAVTITDNIPPVVTCKSATVDLNNSGQGSITTASVFQSATDNCGVINQQSVQPSAFGCGNLGANTVVLTVNDSHGNTNTCTATVTVRDLIKPVVNCPANITRDNDPGICGAAVSYSATATDNCTVASLIALPAAGSLFNVGTSSVSYTATDVAGNTATCSFSVTVRDVERPAITCPANILRENDPGLCSSVTQYADATAIDNCSVQSVMRIDGMPSNSAFPVGVSSITYRAIDIYGNSSTCSFIVDVRDTEKPSITCPVNLTKPNDFGHCGRHMENIGGPSAFSDNCAVDKVYNDSPVDFEIGLTAVTWTALDIHGNTGTCVQNITIFDNDWPIIACPQNIKTTTDEGACEALSVDFNATATDNCPGVTLEYNYPVQSAFPIGYTNVEATATDVYGHQSKCQFQVIVETRKEVCNGIDDDCDGYTDELQDWQQIIKTTSASAVQGDQYGYAVGLWSDWAIVGMNEKNQPGLTTGTAYILHRNADNPQQWDEVSILKDGIQSGEGFGSSVAISNGWAAIGAPRNNQQGQSAGAVVLFKQDPLDPETWTLAKTLYAGDADAGDNFGISISFSGDMLLVGATGDDEAATDAGAGYLFGKNTGGAGNWGPIRKLKADNAHTGDNLGGSVALDGQHAVLGATGDDEKGLNAGAAYVFSQDQGGLNHWGQAGKLTANTGAAGDNFGVSVSVSGGYAIVGASMDDDKGTNSGTAFLFARKGLGWQQITRFNDYYGTPGDEFGNAVSIWGDYAAVAARKNDAKAQSAGSVFIYHREDGGWVQFAQLTDGQGKLNDQFGSAVALYNTTLIAGAPMDDEGGKTDRGSVSIFDGLCSPGNHADQNDERSEGAIPSRTDLVLSPNPSTGTTDLHFFLDEVKDCLIRAYDASGRVVYHQTSTGLKGENVVPINLNGVAPGVYMIDFETEGVKTQQRLVIQR